MLTITPSEIATPDLHQYIIGAVAPRPIAFVSTMDAEGNANLAPYSFFNAFSSNPPMLVFSSNRRVRGNTTKDTLRNVTETRECVINMVSYKMVGQMALASIEYPSFVNEFAKAGLTPLAAEMVKPFRVAESPVQMEAKVKEIISLGEQGGAGNLILCEIVKIHIDETILTEKGRIDPYKIDLVARMGRHYYCRVNGDAIFELVQPVDKMGMGFGQIPSSIRSSKILTGNNLSRLAAEVAMPTEEECQAVKNDPKVMDILAGNQSQREFLLHQYAQSFIENGDIQTAWKILLVN